VYGDRLIGYPLLFVLLIWLFEDCLMNFTSDFLSSYLAEEGNWLFAYLHLGPSEFEWVQEGCQVHHMHHIHRNLSSKENFAHELFQDRFNHEA